MGVVRAGSARRRQCNGCIVDPGQSQRVLNIEPGGAVLIRESGRNARSERSRGEAGRGANEELAAPEEPEGTNRDHRCDGLERNEHDNQHRRCNGRCSSMQNDAERAMVSVGVDGVDVGYLNEGKQSKQRQAEHNDGKPGFGPWALVTTRPWVKSGQTLSILTRGAYGKNTQDWMRGIPRCNRLKHA
jgi:hypothetical protein